MNDDVGAKVGLGVALLTGLGLLAGGAAAGWEAYSFTRRAVTVEGTVVDVESRRSGKSSSTWAKVALDGGREVELRADDLGLEPAAEAGQRVRLLADSRDRDDVRAGSFMGLWFLPAVLGGFGLLTTLGMAAAWGTFFAGRGTRAAPRNGLPPKALRAEVAALLGAGRKLEAVKLVRENSGGGLKEAKELVEAIEREGR